MALQRYVAMSFSLMLTFVFARELLRRSLSYAIGGDVVLQRSDIQRSPKVCLLQLIQSRRVSRRRREQMRSMVQAIDEADP